jgi:shikimate kinase
MNLKLKRTPGIFLVGFMGSGKSTVGKALAAELGWPFVDLDDDIEAAAGMPIAEIFSGQGEAEFRRIEAAALEQRVRQLRAARPLVIALGGGAFAQAANRALIGGTGVTIWLDTPIERIEQRIQGQTHRPLAKDIAAFRSLYAERRDAYAEAEYTVSVDSDQPGEIVGAILRIPGLF